MYIVKYDNDIIAKCKTNDNAWSVVKDYVENDLHYNPYYYRANYINNNSIDVQIDYGSYTHFFYIIKEENDNDK